MSVSGATYRRSSSPAWRARSTLRASSGLERRVVGGGADAGRPQRVDLVLHERDERRDDDAGARPDHGRQLVAQRLAAAGGHEHERVAAGHEMVDDLLLVLAVLGEAEDLAQQVASGARRSRGAGGGGGRGHAFESSKVDGRERPRRTGAVETAPCGEREAENDAETTHGDGWAGGPG